MSQPPIAAPPSQGLLLPHLPATPDPDAILNGFLEAVLARGLEPYPAQEEAILELLSGKHVILNTPTGSGKSLVAEALCFRDLAMSRRCFYTAPVKALVSEKFFDLCGLLGAANVGMMTGDASINRDAPVVCCTAEILANMALREGPAAPVDSAVLDEFHYYGDRERGAAWQIPLLTLPRTTFLLMSATLGDVLDVQRSLQARSGREVAVVRSFDRPVPLAFEYRDTPIHETIADLVQRDRAPIYLVSFTQRECAEQAQALMSTEIVGKEHKRAIAERLQGAIFDTVYGKEMQRFLRHGVGVHHAGLLPKYRLLVEQLSQAGLLKVVCGTDTLGVGVNIPIRTVLFTKLCKFDGEKTGILSVRDFKQISGRAGRKGFDEQGWVVCQAPEHVIENKRLEEKIAAGDKKRHKVVKRRPPERNFVEWDEKTFRRLVEQPPEPLRSCFEVSHGMVLHLLQGGAEHGANGYRQLIELIDLSHETAHAKARHRRRAALLFRALRRASIISLVRNPQTGNRVVINTELQRDFSLNHTLSLYLLEALPGLDPQAPTYSLDVLTLVEAILEDPKVVLWRQIDKLKDAAIAELKAQGVPYEQRMEELERIEHPKPNREQIYDSFNAFAERHPWVGHESIRPKSVAREIFERCCTFNEYVKDYGLQRSEGLLLRYLSDAYRTLLQNVPDPFKDDGVYEVLAFLRSMLREVDASLIRAWEELAEPGAATLSEEEREQRARQRAGVFDPERNPRAFTARLRSELHQLVQRLAQRDFEAAAACLRPTADRSWSPAELEQALQPFVAEHGDVVWGHRARLSELTQISQEAPRRWRVRQTLVDAQEQNQWMIEALIELADVQDPDQPLLELVRIGV